MNKFNFTKLGIQVEYTPITDRQLNVIANEATIQVEDKILSQHFPTSSLVEVKEHLDIYYKYLAIVSYTGTVPLILSTSSWLDSLRNSKPLPRDFEITIVFQKMWLSVYYLEPIRSYTAKEYRSTSRIIGQGLQSLPLLLQVQPRFIVLSEKFDCPDNHTEIVYAFTKVLQYLRDRGIEFIAAGTSTKELQWLPDPSTFYLSQDNDNYLQMGIVSDF